MLRVDDRVFGTRPPIAVAGGPGIGNVEAGVAARGLLLALQSGVISLLHSVSVVLDSAFH